MGDVMQVIPLSLATANTFVSRHHRHHGPVVGHRFSIGLRLGMELIGVAIVGRPEARHLDNGFCAEVTRLCVLEGSPKGACSKLYAACQRVWFAMGGRRIVTYTLESETGASLRGAGWDVTLKKKAQSWNCRSRPRREQRVYLFDKVRWEKNA